MKNTNPLKLGCRDGSVVKRTCCSFRGPGFGSRLTHVTFNPLYVCPGHSHLKALGCDMPIHWKDIGLSSFPVLSKGPSLSVCHATYTYTHSHRHTHAYTLTHTHTHKHIHIQNTHTHEHTVGQRKWWHLLKSYMCLPVCFTMTWWPKLLVEYVKDKWKCPITLLWKGL